jgi:acetyl-CoA C-acetyltransferase
VRTSTRSVIVAGARTPTGKFRGAFAGLMAVELGAHAIRAAVERAGIAGEQVDYAIVGHVLQAGAGQITSLQASIGAGLPKDVPAITINKVCLSGMAAIAMADQMIRAGEIEVAVAGGMESMTNAPYVLPKGREGSRLGDAELIDSMIHDGLWSSFLDHHMGEGTDEVSAELGLTRAEQDAWAARSHQRAHAAWESGRMTDEVVAVEVPQRKGAVVVADRDEGIRPDTTPETLAGLKPAFRADGTITAGNASQISDGACAVVVMSAEKAQELGVRPLAEIVAYGMSSDRYPSLHTVPAMALERALKKSGLAASDLGLIEINEAFAAVPIHSARMLGVDDDIVNVNGGAVALGHPIGASGARIVLTLVMEMRRRGVDLGGAAICGGGGQGDALILRVPKA